MRVRGYEKLSGRVSPALAGIVRFGGIQTCAYRVTNKIRY